MSIDQLVELLTLMHPLSEEVKGALRGSFKEVSFPKGHYLIQANTPAQHAFFILNGFAVGYRYEAGKRVVTDFWQRGEIILSPKSFFGQWAGDEIIQLTIDSQLLSISYPVFEQLVERYPVINSLARDFTAESFAKAEERIVELHTLSTWERYLKLLKSYEGIEQYVSQEMIASYLNITPQSLSRLKSEHHKS